MSQMFVAALTHASTLGSPAITRPRHSPDPWLGRVWNPYGYGYGWSSEYPYPTRAMPYESS